jgi:hypothetical protein
MRGDVIPFIPASFGSFVVLVFTFVILGIAIYTIQLRQNWCWPVVKALVGQMRWDRKTRDSFPDQPTSEIQQDVEKEAGWLQCSQQDVHFVRPGRTLRTGLGGLGLA